MKEDLLKGAAPYVRKGQLYFNEIKVSESRIEFLNKSKLLMTMDFPKVVSFRQGETATVALTEGKMKIKIV